jgi:hypothetical protein
MPTIYKLETICSRSRNFNSAALKAARSQALASKGRAMLVVHPFFTQRFSADESLEMTDPNLFRQIMAKDYDAYVRHLGSVLKTTTMVPFVLSGENLYDKVSGWLNGMTLNKNVYMAGTISNDPTPIFSFDSVMTKWHFLARTMKDIGISSVFIAGEMAYWQKDENVGCVFAAHEELSPHLPVKILHHLTFPGIY